MQKLRIVVADEQPLMRLALETLLKRELSMQLMGACENVEDLLRLSLSVDPHVLIIDSDLPQLEKSPRRTKLTELLEQISIKWPQTKIVVMSANCTDILFKEVNQLASGFVAKEDDWSLRLVSVIKTVSKGGQFFSESIVPFFMEENQSLDEIALTPRQTEILQLISKEPALPYLELARILGIAVPTLKSHLTRAYKTLDVKNAMGAIVKAKELKMIF